MVMGGKGRERESQALHNFQKSYTHTRHLPLLYVCQLSPANHRERIYYYKQQIECLFWAISPC